MQFPGREEDLEFEADLIEDLCLKKSFDEIAERCSQYKMGSYQWALWLLEKGEGYTF